MSIEKIAPLQPIQSINPLTSIEKPSESGSEISGMPFSSILSNAISDISQTQAAVDENNIDIITGTEADLHDIMMDTAMNTLAVETAVEVSSRAVSAYKEIMSMQI